MNKKKLINILLVEDDEADYFMFKDILSDIKNTTFNLHWSSNYTQGIEEITQNKYDVCFVDYRLGAKSGLDFLKENFNKSKMIPIIILTGVGEHETDLEAMRLGAADYLSKDEITASVLERCIRYAIHRTQSLNAILDREAQILMQDRLASIGLLASSLAHEIGTPLGVIRGRAEYLEMQIQDNPNVKKNVDIIITQIDRVSRLIQSLLNLARGEKTSSALSTDLTKSIHEITELMEHEFKRRNIKLVDTIPSNRILIKAEQGALQQVLLNLLVNAMHAIESSVKLSNNQTHEIRISLSDSRNNNSVDVNITDTGCGISKENLKNIFKPFFTTKDIGQGTGLGLATSYRILETWGGSIEVKSTENKGSTFTLVLPRA